MKNFNTNLSIIVEPFLFREIIKEKSDNIIFTINTPKFEKNVLNSDKNHEGHCNAYYTIILENNEYKMYYRSLPHPCWKDKNKIDSYSTEELTPYEYLCLATSNDGINFEKKNYNIIEYKGDDNNNILKHDLFCHNFFPFYMKKENKYIGISGTGIFNNGLFLFESIDGINWTKNKKIIDGSNLLPGWIHKNHFDTHNCIVYNDLDEYYYIYVRENNPERRFVQYTKTKDFNIFTKFQNINIIDDENLALYMPGIFKYPKSNYFLSIPLIQGTKYTDKKTNRMYISHNGHDWSLLTDNLFNHTNAMIVNGMVHSIDNKLYIYKHENLTLINNCINCYSFEMNRIQKIICNEDGFIKTNLIYIKNNNLLINCETSIDGYIIIDILNTNNEKIITSKKIIGNYLDYEIIWETNLGFEENNYYIQFNLYKSILYSFSYEC